VHAFGAVTYKRQFEFLFEKDFCILLLSYMTWVYFLFQSHYYRSPEVLLGYPYPTITYWHVIICFNFCLNFLLSLMTFWFLHIKDGLHYTLSEKLTCDASWYRISYTGGCILNFELWYYISIFILLI
jgi:hypothetical protein